jgi:saccharopine dehydrogenase (NAD+, L-lysine forming)
MPERIRFGVIGGYGSTGAVVVSELAKSRSAILAGGRDLQKASGLAAKIGGQVAAAQVDALNANSLDAFCQRCAIIVNCASPVMLLQDRVAQAALRARCHYVDAASLLIVKDRLLPHNRDIASAGLCFVTSAGWLPGASELAPAYAALQARSSMDQIESVTLYFGDTGEWSTNAFQEMAFVMHRLGFSKRGYFRKGQWMRASLREASRKIDLDPRIGLWNFYMFSIPEMGELAASLSDCDFTAYACLPGTRTALVSSLVAMLPLSENLGGRLLRNSFRKNRLPVGGFIVVHVAGQSRGSPARFKVQLIYEEGREYWVNGLIPATVARLISERKEIKTGINYVANAVNPITLISELRKSGVDFTESRT